MMVQEWEKKAMPMILSMRISIAGCLSIQKSPCFSTGFALCLSWLLVSVHRGAVRQIIDLLNIFKRSHKVYFKVFQQSTRQVEYPTVHDGEFVFIIGLLHSGSLNDIDALFLN